MGSSNVIDSAVNAYIQTGGPKNLAAYYANQQAIQAEERRRLAAQESIQALFNPYLSQPQGGGGTISPQYMPTAPIGFGVGFPTHPQAPIGAQPVMPVSPEPVPGGTPFGSAMPAQDTGRTYAEKKEFVRRKQLDFLKKTMMYSSMGEEQAKQAKWIMDNSQLFLQGPVSDAITEANSVVQSTLVNLETNGPDIAERQFGVAMQQVSPDTADILSSIIDPENFVPSLRNTAAIFGGTEFAERATESAFTRAEAAHQSGLKKEEITLQADYDQRRKETAQPQSQRELLEIRKLQAQIAELDMKKNKDERQIRTEEEKKKKTKQLMLASTGRVMGLVGDALGYVGKAGSTGLAGWLTKSIPTTPGFVLQKAIDTISANIGFDYLTAMREASPSGGALGQVSQIELAYLQAVIANLDIGQPREILIANLESVRKHYKNWRNTMIGMNPYSEDDMANMDTKWNEILPDGTTMEDIRFTAEKYGMDEKEVITVILNETYPLPVEDDGS